MKILVQNFRSIQSQEVEIAPITLFYGPNASGKSSFLYALLTLRNIVLAPNQQVPGFFNFQVVSLGGFREVVFNHDMQKEIRLGIHLEKEVVERIEYGIELRENQGRFFINRSVPWQSGQWGLPVSFPYPGNQQIDLEIRTQDGKTLTFTWNGLTCGIAQPIPPPPEAEDFVRWLNAPVAILRKVAFVPHRRGFFQPQYSMLQASPFLMQDTELASLLASDKYLQDQVSFWLEEIANRSFRVHFQPGTGLFSLDTFDRSAGVTTELVNDGFGVNQLVYLLAKVLHPEVQIVCIEEPEIHLHPSAIRRLARRLVKLTREEEKYLLMTSHSEALVTAFLAVVARGELRPEDLACYLVTKEGKVSKFGRQVVNEKGQVEGGLGPFMEGELEDIRAFLGVEEER